MDLWLILVKINFIAQNMFIDFKSECLDLQAQLDLVAESGKYKYLLGEELDDAESFVIAR